jgi:hypothetical protein
MDGVSVSRSKQVRKRGQHPVDTLVDDKDRHILADGYWTLTVRGYVARCVSNSGNREFLHDLIARPSNGFVVDHKNGNKRDNRRENLRIVTQAENVQNRAFLNKNNKTGYRNVQYVPRLKRWKAEVKINRKSYHLGYFASPTAAAHAATEFRRHNMPGYIHHE